jgi:hypothetical protein
VIAAAAADVVRGKATAILEKSHKVKEIWRNFNLKSMFELQCVSFFFPIFLYFVIVFCTYFEHAIFHKIPATVAKIFSHKELCAPEVFDVVCEPKLF